MCVSGPPRRRSLTTKLPTSAFHPLHSSPSTVVSGDPGKVTNKCGAEGAAQSPSCQQQEKQHQPHRALPLHHKPEHHVQHTYHDHATDPKDETKYATRGGVTTPFPLKLHQMLDKIEQDGLAHVVSWQPHGRCFVVHKPKEFLDHVMPKYFKQSKFASFQRQLNLYGFNRLTSGLDRGGYYHELFLRNKTHLCHKIHRMRVKGTGVRMASSPETEPNFYNMPPVGIEFPHSGAGCAPKQKVQNEKKLPLVQCSPPPSSVSLASSSNSRVPTPVFSACSPRPRALHQAQQPMTRYNPQPQPQTRIEHADAKVPKITCVYYPPTATTAAIKEEETESEAAPTPITNNSEFEDGEESLDEVEFEGKKFHYLAPFHDDISKIVEPSGRPSQRTLPVPDPTLSSWPTIVKPEVEPIPAIPFVVSSAPPPIPIFSNPTKSVKSSTSLVKASAKAVVSDDDEETPVTSFVTSENGDMDDFFASLGLPFDLNDTEMDCLGDDKSFGFMLEKVLD